MIKLFLSKEIKLLMVSKLSFVCSAIFTIMLMASSVNGFLAIALAICLAILLEYGKVTMIGEALSRKSNHHWFMRTLMIAMCVLLVMSSIIASQAQLYMTTKAKKTVNKQATFEYDSDIDELNMMIDKYKATPATYATKSMELQSLIQIKKDDIQRKKDNGEYTKTISTNGYDDYFQCLSDSTGNRVSSDSLSFNLFAMLAILSEILCVLFEYLYRREVETVETKDFTSKDYDRFYKLVTKDKKSGDVVRGYQSISKELEIDEKIGRCIHQTMVLDGLLKVNGKQSRLV